MEISLRGVNDNIMHMAEERVRSRVRALLSSQAYLEHWLRMNFADNSHGNVKINEVGNEYAHGKSARESGREAYVIPGLLQTLIWRGRFLLLSAATIGGVGAAVMRMPPIVGYIAGGVLVGPSGWALVHTVVQVETLAQFG